MTPTQSRFAALKDLEEAENRMNHEQGPRHSTKMEKQNKAIRDKDKLSHAKNKKEGQVQSTDLQLLQLGKKNRRQGLVKDPENGQMMGKKGGNKAWALRDGQLAQNGPSVHKEGPHKGMGQENRDGRSVARRGDDLGQNNSGENKKDKPKIAGRRTHVVVTGHMASLNFKEGSVQNSISEGPRKLVTGQSSMHDQRCWEKHNHNGQELIMSQIKEMANVLIDPEPPDPGNQEEGELWEEVATDLTEEQSEEVEFVPETADDR